MPKRKMIQSNLLKNSIAAYFAAIEIHNKPKIAYRYETVTLLMHNAWELALKAYIRKNIKHKNIFEKDNSTISFEKALSYVAEDVNSKKPKSFEAIKRNIEIIKDYRNSITHLYCDKLETYIFSLVARSALNYVEFIKNYFSRDIMAHDGLFIIPIGFKLPFKPEEFLSKKSSDYSDSPEGRVFIQSIVRTIRELDAAGVDDSIVLGFDVYFQGAKKPKNSDILAAIVPENEAEVSFHKLIHVKFSDNPHAQQINMSDEEFRNIYEFQYKDVIKWCKENIESFKQSKIFYEVKREVEKDNNCAYRRQLDSKNAKSPSRMFYSEKALEEIKRRYLKIIAEENHSSA